VTFQPIPVLINSHGNNEGRLVLADGQLVAVLVRLDGDVDAAELKGSWFLESGTGHCSVVDPPLFPDLADARSWVEGRLQTA
jgi:hypothetical protein